MSATENKEIINKFLADIAAGGDLMSDDIRWTVGGTTLYSGTFNGKQDLMDRLFTPLIGQLESLGSMTVENMIAEDDYVVVQSQASGRMTKTGKPYNNSYCVVFRLADGKITEVDEYCDTELVTSAFGTT